MKFSLKSLGFINVRDERKKNIIDRKRVRYNKYIYQHNNVVIKV